MLDDLSGRLLPREGGRAVPGLRAVCAERGMGRSGDLHHHRIRRQQIVGGGDLSIADEALKHKNVKEVVLVDIDDRVIALCKQHFGEINAKAFKDKRMVIEAADAFEYLGRKSSKNRFDLIIAPIKVEHGTGGPTRIFAVMANRTN